MFKIRSFFRNLRAKISNLIFIVYRATFKSTAKIMLLLSLFVIGVIAFVFFKFFSDDAKNYFIGTVAGLTTTVLIGSLANLIALGFEDRNKVSKDFEELSKKYKFTSKTENIIKGNKEETVVLNKDDNYVQEVIFNDSSKVNFLYKSNFTKADKIIVKDNKEKLFVPTDVMTSNYVALIKAHRGSFKKNGLTVRVDEFKFDIENNILEINTSRSTYYNHLISNRVLDYPFEKSLTLREIYEPGPVLTSLKNSVFSNHLGIIGILKTKDNYFIINQRSNKGSTSKNILVAPVSYGLSATKKDDVDEQYILNSIIKSVNHRTDIRGEIDKKYIDEIINVGYGRDVYEAGKPHLFYLIKLNIKKDEYLDLFKKYKCPDENIDDDKRTFAIKPNELKFKNKFYYITHHDSNGKIKKHLLDAEINLIMNIKCLMEHNMFE